MNHCYILHKCTHCKNRVVTVTAKCGDGHYLSESLHGGDLRMWWSSLPIAVTVTTKSLTTFNCRGDSIVLSRSSQYACSGTSHLTYCSLYTSCVCHKLHIGMQHAMWYFNISWKSQVQYHFYGLSCYRRRPSQKNTTDYKYSTSFYQYMTSVWSAIYYNYNYTIM